MERDFMGLNSKSPVVVVKEESIEGSKDSGFFKDSSAPWPLSNAFDPSMKLQSVEIKNRHGGTQFPVTPYPGGQQHMYSMLQRGNQGSPTVNMNNPSFKTHFAGQQPIKQQSSVLPSIAGGTEPWLSSKASRAPAQLTIFYGGMVNVFDAISPEKAQAIFFMAGNACNMGQARAQIQAPMSKLPAADDLMYVNHHQPNNTPPCSALSSPMSVSSHPPHCAGAANNDGLTPKIAGLDASRIASSSMAHLTATAMIPNAVPQARKASLARFLEKRKERVMNAAPYSPNKTNGEAGFSFSGSSGMGSAPISSANS